MKFVARCAEDMAAIGKAIRGIGWPVAIEAKPHKANRTLEQNARIWALMNEISQQAPSAMGGEWWAPEVWYDYCARRFGGVEPGPFGQPARVHPSKFDKQKFSDYMTEVEAWAATELGVQFSVTRAA